MALRDAAVEALARVEEQRARLEAQPVVASAAEMPDAEAARDMLLANLAQATLRMQHDLDQAELALLRGRERDRLQAERPPGCHCLGVGGAGVLVELYGLQIWSRPCHACPEGQALITDPGPQDDACPGEQRESTRDDPAAEGEVQGRLAAARLPGIALERSWADFTADAAKQTAVLALERFAAGPPPAVWTRGPDGRAQARPGERLRGALLSGPFGTGKTTLLALACRAWCEAGGSALLTTVADWLELQRPPDERRLVDRPFEPGRALTVGLLALDDLGAETLTAWGRERLFTLVNTRYEALRPTLFSSNYAPDEIAARLVARDGADPREGARILERIVEACALVHVGGRNYRERS